MKQSDAFNKAAECERLMRFETDEGGILGLLLGVRGMLFGLRVVILSVVLGSGAMRFCGILVVFSRLNVFVFGH